MRADGLPSARRGRQGARLRQRQAFAARLAVPADELRDGIAQKLLAPQPALPLVHGASLKARMRSTEALDVAHLFAAREPHDPPQVRAIVGQLQLHA